MTLKATLSIVAASLLALCACGTAKKAAPATAEPVKHNFPVIEQQGKTAIVAHRGFWKCAAAGFAQNSIASLREAQAHGLWGSECDIHLTSDNVILVHHDETIHGVDIQKNPYAAFEAHRLKNGEPVPTLDQYLTQAEESDKTVLIIELKPHYAQDREDLLVDLTLKAVKEHGLLSPSRVVFISFSKHICDLLAARCPEFVNQYLEGDISPEDLAKDAINGFDYEQDVILGDGSIVARAHALGMSTNAWTVNGEEKMKKLIDLGIDAITTNEPLLLRELLDAKEFKNK